MVVVIVVVVMVLVVGLSLVSIPEFSTSFFWLGWACHVGCCQGR